jgi:site-specific DNA-methyltransferase (adenine-specific)
MVKNSVHDIGKSEKKQGGDLLTINKQIQMRKQKLYNINEPNKLLEFINDNLKPKDVEKKLRGEVFTPMKLVGEMLDTLPEEVWKNPNLKWLDPAAGMGNFPVAVYMRLIEGLKYVKGYEDDEKRRKHILENMLYMVEIDKTNVFMMRKIFCGKIYKLNIFEGSFIEGKNIEGINYTKEEIYNNNGFDIIVGNPPYNQGGVGKGGGVFWKYFVDKSFKILNNNGYILMIHPTGWRKPTSINASAGDIWKLFKNYNLMFLKISDKKIPGFPRVDYYVLNKNTKQQDTEVINIFELNQITKSSLNLYTLPFIPHLINKEVLSIINKILNKRGEKFNIIYNQVIKPKKCDKITVGVPHAHYFDINNKNYQEKNSLYLTKPDYISHPKIIMTYNSGKKPAYLYAKYYSKELGTTNNTMYQIIKKADNKNNLVSFLNSRLIHFILKITQYSSPPNYKNEFNILNMFAKPNEDDITNDEDIYDYFKLTRKEINLIEENTKGFDKITGGLNKNKYKKYKLAKHYLNKKPKYNSI